MNLSIERVLKEIKEKIDDFNPYDLMNEYYINLLSLLFEAIKTDQFKKNYENYTGIFKINLNEEDYNHDYTSSYIKIEFNENEFFSFSLKKHYLEIEKLF